MAERTCSVEDCGVRVVARGLCSKHYTRWQKTGTTELAVAECAAEGCATVLRSSNKTGFCTPHYHLGSARRERHRVNEHNRKLRERALVVRPVCSYESCLKTLRFNNESGYCKEHHAFSPARRAGQRAWRQRKDRPCSIDGCGNFARTSTAYCADCENERTSNRRRQQRAGMRERLFEKQKGLCPPPEWGGCGLPMSLSGNVQVDHIYPTARGGSDEEWNKQLMHGFCNQSKRDKIVPALRRKAAA
jgi:HNH endonuclease